MPLPSDMLPAEMSQDAGEAALVAISMVTHEPSMLLIVKQPSSQALHLQMYADFQQSFLVL